MNKKETYLIGVGARVKEQLKIIRGKSICQEEANIYILWSSFC